MIGVFAGVVLLASLAALYVVHGARRGGAERGDRARANLGVFADRRRELAVEGRMQGLADTEIAVLEEELAASVVDELPESAAGDPGDTTAPPASRTVVAVLLAAVASVALYAFWGEPDVRLLARAGEILRDSNPPQGTLAELDAALTARVARRPEDRDSLFHLGHLKVRRQDFQGAARIFARLRESTGADPEIEASWAQARYLADGGRISVDTRAAIERVVAARPDDPMMLELLAMDAMRRDDFAEAARHLASLLRVTPAGPRRSLFGEALVLAHARLVPEGEPAATGADAGRRTPVERAQTPGASEVPGPDPASGTSRGGVAVAVSVSPALIVDAGATVFVIARDPSGRAGPPYAVRRLAVADLPARVELGDADAMLPGRRLSDLEAVELVARISVNGSPMRAAGDFESVAKTTRVGAETVLLDIARQVP